MNLQHLKYAVEVAKCKSISKAAENLFMGQPNLSRSIKELEDSLGITIFNRTTKGITITPRGEEFLQHAEGILAQVDYVQSLYGKSEAKEQVFSISVPRASYISHSFVKFAARLDQSRKIDVYYKETNSLKAISNIINDDYNLGIVRFQEEFEQYFAASFREKGLDYQDLLDFSPLALMSADHPLARKDKLSLNDFESYLEVAHGDPYIPSLPGAEARKAEYTEATDKRIYIFERGSQFDLLSDLNTTFMWVSPLPEPLLKRHHLVQKWVADNDKIYKDVLIYKKGYHFSDMDKLFLDTLMNVKQNLKVII